MRYARLFYLARRLDDILDEKKKNRLGQWVLPPWSAYRDEAEQLFGPMDRIGVGVVLRVYGLRRHEGLVLKIGGEGGIFNVARAEGMLPEGQRLTAETYWYARYSLLQERCEPVEGLTNEHPAVVRMREYAARYGIIDVRTGSTSKIVGPPPSNATNIMKNRAGHLVAVDIFPALRFFGGRKGKYRRG